MPDSRATVWLDSCAFHAWTNTEKFSRPPCFVWKGIAAAKYKHGNVMMCTQSCMFHAWTNTQKAEHCKQKILPVANKLQNKTSKLYTPLRLQKAFKAFFGCVIAWYEMFIRKLALSFLDEIFTGVVPGLFRSLKKFNYVSWFHFWIPKI